MVVCVEIELVTVMEVESTSTSAATATADMTHRGWITRVGGGVGVGTATTPATKVGTPMTAAAVATATAHLPGHHGRTVVTTDTSRWHSRRLARLETLPFEAAHRSRRVVTAVIATTGGGTHSSQQTHKHTVRATVERRIKS